MKYHAPIAGLVLALVLLIGVPLYLRTPVWVDVTYHDISARNVLQGGVHYRDVFETNLPGMVWLHCLVRPLVGWSHEAIRVVDLAVFFAIALALTRPLRMVGVTLAGRLWFLTIATLFYVYEGEFIHVQRDGWMLLPSVLALLVTLRRMDLTPPAPLSETERGEPSQADFVCLTNKSAQTNANEHPKGVRDCSPLSASERGARGVRLPFLEGCLWGCAVWIKPHVLVPALFVWLVSWRFAGRANVRGTLGLFAGGLLLGALGCAWLIGTGTWKPMWDVMLNWNGEYYEWSWADTFYKVQLVGVYFAPFSLFHLVTVPLALYAIFRREPAAALLAALYLGWLVQATFIQKMFDYAHSPPMILSIAVLASTRLPIGPFVLGWCVLGGLMHSTLGEQEWFTKLKARYPATFPQVVPKHRIAQGWCYKLWPRCWSDSSWELKDQLTQYLGIVSAPEWADLHTVAEYLRTQDVHDMDVIAWHDSTHPLYLELGIRPGIRFPHVITAMRMRSKIPTIREETFRSPARFVVSDLEAVSHLGDFAITSYVGPAERLPRDFPPELDDVYPWNQPVVFRAGRYVVHRVTVPHGTIDFAFK